MIRYEESALPPLAVAPAGWQYLDAEQWVRANSEPLMVRDGNGCYMLVRIGAQGGPVIEPPGVIGNILDTRLAASRFRELLRNQAGAT